MAGKTTQVRGGTYCGPGAHGIHGPVHPALVERQEFVRHTGDSLGDVEHPFVQFVGGKRSVGIADPYRLGGIHGVAGEHHLHGVSESHQPGMHSEVRCTGDA